MFDILQIFFSALLSTLRQPHRLPQRSWLTELVFRFVKNLFNRSKDKPASWLRQRLPKIYSPAFSRVQFEATTLAAVPVQWCRPRAASERDTMVIYFHGGGYVVGSVNNYRNTLAALTVASDCPVIGVDYRLGPEHLFPAAQDDCLAVSRHLLQAHPETRVVLAGDSAGGALAIASYLALAAEGASPLPCGLALISPWVDPGASEGSILSSAHSDIVDFELLTQWRAQYLAAASPTDSRICFTRQDLSMLPPTYIQAAGAEVLLDQIQEFAGRAKQAGVELTLDIYPGQFHVFQVFSPLVKSADEAIVRLGEFVIGASRNNGGAETQDLASGATRSG